MNMKALLSASSSLSRRLLSQSSTRRKCVKTAAAASGGRRVVCAVHENRRHSSNAINIDVSCKIIASKSRISHPCRRLMGTDTRGQEEDVDIDVAVRAANER